MTDAPILSERVGHTQIITLNRPEAMNAITWGLFLKVAALGICHDC